MKKKRAGWACTTRHAGDSKILLPLRETQKRYGHSTLNTHSACTPEVFSYKTGNVERRALWLRLSVFLPRFKLPGPLASPLQYPIYDFFRKSSRIAS